MFPETKVPLRLSIILVPFGAVIVKEGKIIAKGHNEVLGTNDPTAHAEIVVIRKASQKLDKFDLSDCEIYTTCEPCPMCMAAIMWARIEKIFYGCTAKDAQKIKFSDQDIYDYLKGKKIKQKLKKTQINI